MKEGRRFLDGEQAPEWVMEEISGTTRRVDPEDCRTVGVISKGFPYWGLCTSTMGGRLRWVATDYQDDKIKTMVWKKAQPSWGPLPSKNMETSWLSTKAGTEVVLLDGLEPGINHPVWQISGLKIVAWVTARARGKAPQGWETKQWNADHQKLGGVTDSRQRITVAGRQVDLLNPTAEMGVKLCMLESIDKLVVGRGAMPPQPGEDRERILKWSKRGDTLVLPSYKSKTGWVMRKLAAVELAGMLDWPVGIVRALGENLTWRMVEDTRTPFKIRQYLGEYIRAVLEDREPTAQVSKQDKSENVLQEGSYRLVDLPALHENDWWMKYVVDSGDEHDRMAKAVKSDDAKVPTMLWDIRTGLFKEKDHQRMPRVMRACNLLRRKMWGRWMRNIYRSYLRYRRGELMRRGLSTLPDGELDAAREALMYAAHSDWWEWHEGSSIFFWRWPKAWEEEIRDGLAPFFLGKPPCNLKPQRVPRDEETFTKLAEKLQKWRDKGYMGKGAVTSLINVFAVPKGDDDIRLVFDGTASGLNEILWAPWFYLPTAGDHVRCLDPGFYCMDHDYGEMFYNFKLHKDLQPLTGIDITDIYPEELLSATRRWEHWFRPCMGMCPAPYQATRAVTVLKRELYRNRRNKDDPFHWDSVLLNLPGTDGYEPHLPWIYKIRFDGCRAVEIVIFVDDARLSAPTEPLAWEAGSKLAKLAAHWGLQIALRKVRRPSTRPGSWAGVRVVITNDEVYLCVSDERWAKTQEAIYWMLEEAKRMSGMDFKRLESIRGFLVYVSQVYISMKPYLRGIHMTLDSWRPNRDEDGWKVMRKTEGLADFAEALGQEEGAELNLDIADEVQDKPPDRVKPAPRLADDLHALQTFTSGASPPLRRARPKPGAAVKISFLDASGAGYGDNEASSKDAYREVKYTYGTWRAEISIRSSNDREMRNCLKKLVKGMEEGRYPEGTEVFVFTDNQTLEAAFNKGTSTSRELHEMILKLRKLEFDGKIFLHIIWVAGKRMIAQGADGLSRGDLCDGVMAGASMNEFVPLAHSCIDVMPAVKMWVESWAVLDDGERLDWLSHADWFERAHECGGFRVWTPPPAVADVAATELSQSVHINGDAFHIFITPCVMGYRWRKTLSKVADVVTQIPVGPTFWPCDMCEPLTIAIVCPLLNKPPFRIGERKLGRDLDASVRKVWKQNPEVGSHRLREFWCQARGLVRMHQRVVRGVL